MEGEVAVAQPITITLFDKDGNLLARSGSRATNQVTGLDKLNMDHDLVKVEAEAGSVPSGVTELKVKARSRPTLGAGISLTLQRVTGTYLFKGEFNPKLLFRDNASYSKPSFSSIDWSRGDDAQGDSLSFLTNVLLRNGDGGGRAFFGADPTLLSRNFNDIEASIQFGVAANDQLDLQTVERDVFQAGGYETVQVEVDDPNFSSKNRVLARFNNAANVLMLSGHGSFNGFTNLSGPNILLADRRGPKPSNAFTSDKWKSIKTLIIAGCVACNLNDYALNSRNHVDQSEVDSEYFKRIRESSPARTLKELIHPDGIILGYQSGAPVAPYDALPISEFFASMGSTWISQVERTPLLWMRANAKVDRLDNASAMDSEHFYFITHTEKAGPIRKIPFYGKRQTITYENRKIVRVAREDWNKPLLEDHTFEPLDELPDVTFEVNL